MRLERFFVIAVIVLGTLWGVACETKKKPAENTTAELVKEGDQKLRDVQLLQAELELRYHILLRHPEMKGPQGETISGVTLAQDYNWHRLARSERNTVKGKLAEYAALTSQILQIDAKEGVVVDSKEEITRWRDNALHYHRALDRFEKIFGEQYEPKRDSGAEPLIYNRSQEV